METINAYCPEECKIVVDGVQVHIQKSQVVETTIEFN